MSQAITTLSISIGLLATAVATVSVITGRSDAAPPRQAYTPRQLVDALHTAFGQHHARAVHTKGIILEGVFEPDAQAAALTRAPHLQRTSSTVVVRFSDFTGLPDIPDNSAGANPRGLAIRFTLPDGTSTDIVGHSFNGFPTASSDEFRDLLLAIAASGPAAAKPSALDQFLGAHPIAKTFLTTQKTPASFGKIAYYGVNSFQFTNAKGASRYVRYQFIPEDGEHTLSAAEAGKLGANYLQDEIRTRIAKAPVRFRLYAQIAEAGDKIDDPSIAWPDTRARIALGTITVTKLGVNTAEQDQALAFSPNNLPDGIKTADPMLDFRSKAYPLSVDERR